MTHRTPVRRPRSPCAAARLPCALVGLAAALGAPGCSAPPDEPPPAGAVAGAATADGRLAIEELEHPALQNLLRVSGRIYSSGEPRGDGAFAELARRGVRTVVSVDGVRPDVETAERHGLRYVHIPVGYDGIREPAGRALAALLLEAEVPVYIHCHHGRHRGPAVAAVACIAAGEAGNAEARRILEVAGTSEDYGGLWRDVAAYRPPPPDAELPALVPVAEVGSFAAAMALVDRAWDDLVLCREADWAVPADHPDLVPSREALHIREGLHEAERTLGEDAAEELRTWLAEAEATAAKLRSALEAGDAAAADERFEALRRSCKRCHRVYRN